MVFDNKCRMTDDPEGEVRKMLLTDRGLARSYTGLISSTITVNGARSSVRSFE